MYSMPVNNVDDLQERIRNGFNPQYSHPGICNPAFSCISDCSASILTNFVFNHLKIEKKNFWIKKSKMYKKYFAISEKGKNVWTMKIGGREITLTLCGYWESRFEKYLVFFNERGTQCWDVQIVYVDARRIFWIFS